MSKIQRLKNVHATGRCSSKKKKKSATTHLITLYNMQHYNLLQKSRTKFALNLITVSCSKHQPNVSYRFILLLQQQIFN